MLYSVYLMYKKAYFIYITYHILIIYEYLIFERKFWRTC